MSDIQIDITKTHKVTSIEFYKGYQIIDKDEYVVIALNGGAVASAHTPAEARTIIDGLVAEREARYQANLKKMGRHEPKETDLI